MITVPATVRRLLGPTAAVAALAVLGVEVARSRFDPGDVVWPLVLAAVAVTVGAQVVAATNVRAFCRRRPALSGLVLAQFAVCFVRTLAPSALGTAGVLGRHLRRRGTPGPEVAGALAASQLSQAVTTTALVATVSITTGRHWSAPWPVWAAVAGGLIGSLAVGAVVARRSTRVRSALTATRDAATGVVRHARDRPGQIVVGMAAGVLLTVVHVAAFALIAAAAGVHAGVPVLLLVYLGAMTAGSMVPTPGGIGAVEAALTGGLMAAGAAAGPAAAAALLARFVTVWAMALPGWFALRALRRRDLL